MNELKYFNSFMKSVRLCRVKTLDDVAVRMRELMLRHPGSHWKLAQNVYDAAASNERIKADGRWKVATMTEEGKWVEVPAISDSYPEDEEWGLVEEVIPQTRRQDWKGAMENVRKLWCTGLFVDSPQRLAVVLEAVALYNGLADRNNGFHQESWQETFVGTPPCFQPRINLSHTPTFDELHANLMTMARGMLPLQAGFYADPATLSRIFHNEGIEAAFTALLKALTAYKEREKLYAKALEVPLVNITVISDTLRLQQQCDALRKQREALQKRHREAMAAAQALHPGTQHMPTLDEVRKALWKARKIAEQMGSNEEEWKVCRQLQNLVKALATDPFIVSKISHVDALLKVSKEIRYPDGKIVGVRTVSELGENTFIAVRMDTDPQRTGSFKVCFPAVMPPVRDLPVERLAWLRFRRHHSATNAKEVQMHERLRHLGVPHILPLLAHRLTGPDPFTLQPFLYDGQTLLNWLRREEKDPGRPSQRRQILLKVAQELTTTVVCMGATGHGHLDIKLGNTLYKRAPDGSVEECFLCDFGSTRYIPPGVGLVENLTTANYRAPEIWMATGMVRSKDGRLLKITYGPEVDLWALATLLFEIRYDHILNKHWRDEPASPAEVAAYPAQAGAGPPTLKDFTKEAILTNYLKRSGLEKKDLDYFDLFLLRVLGNSPATRPTTDDWMNFAHVTDEGRHLYAHFRRISK